MNYKNILTIARKDMTEAFQNQSVVLPMIIIPLVFIIIFPLAIIVLPSISPATAGQMYNDPDFQGFFSRLPAAISNLTAGLPIERAMILMMIGMMFAPFFLIIPLMFSTVIAAESFAGERERKTIEALLYTPVSDTDLFLGKVLAGMSPAVLTTWVCFLVYIVVVNSATYFTLGWSGWFPLASWYPLIFWVSPGLSLLGISFTVLISSRNPTFMGAYQSSAALVMLVLALIAGQAAGVVYLTVGTDLVIGLMIWLIAAALTYYAIRTFNRQKLLAAAD
jgi:ABC-2 type transport system permease protein